ncbi:MAG: hypothetical protein HYY09_08650 [Firmicutes bacterium]|nr:hypothetical protein [Bacillota bacterium]
MPEVFNWQLGRPMRYPYDESRPKRQFSAVFNINRCLGCQTCTMACKSTWTFSRGQEQMWWNNVETKPYGGYPQNWDVKLLEILGPQAWNGEIYQGQTIFESAPPSEPNGHLPDLSEWRFPNIHEDTSVPWQKGAALPVHDTWFFYLQRICNHCTYPACLAACPRKAIYKRPEDGIVLVDQSRCRGYRYCNKACPYKKTMFRGTSTTTEKCVACYPRVEEGQVTRCIAACIGKIRLQGWVDDEKSPIHYLVRKEKVALPLYPQFGTEPNVYYIPPRWVPREFLTQMFGPGAEAAIAKYSNPSPELLAILQLFGATDRIIHSYDFDGVRVVGFDENRREILRVKINEEVIVRPEGRMNIS